MELIEPDELTPGLPIDDIVRHSDDIAQAADNVATQIHHFASDKNKKTFTPLFKEMTEKFGLGLDEAWSKAPVPAHSGRHPNEYNRWVLKQMEKITEGLSTCNENCAEVFIEKFTELVIQPVMENPDMVHKKFWEMME